MAGLRGVLLLPWRPGAAVALLEGRPAAALFALVPPLLLGTMLRIAGCEVWDALAAAAALLAVVSCMGALGAAACRPAALLAGGRAGRRLATCLAAAGWAPLLFAALVAAAAGAGLGNAAPLVASVLLLAWGVLQGVALAGAQDAEPGRRLVASCLGLVGALAGLWLSLSLVAAHLVFAVPAPVGAPCFERGDLLVVRRQAAAPPGAVVVLQDLVLARVDDAGRPVPLPVRADGRAYGRAEARETAESRNRDVLGRVFFRLGARGASPVGIPGQTG